MIIWHEIGCADFHAQWAYKAVICRN